MAVIRYIGDRFAGLSTDVKPTGNLHSGAHFEELDTYKTYTFVTGGWVWTNDFSSSAFTGNAELGIGDVTFIVPYYDPTGDQQYYLDISESGLYYEYGKNQLTVNVNGLTQVLNTDYFEDSGAYYPTGTAILFDYLLPIDSIVNVKVTALSGSGALVIGGGGGGNTYNYYNTYTGSTIVSGDLYTGSIIVSGDYYTGSVIVSGDLYTGSIIVSGNYYTGCTVVSGDLYTGSIIVSGDLYTGSIIVSGDYYTGSIIVSGDYYTGSIIASGNYYTGCTIVSGDLYTGSIIVSGNYYTGCTIISGNYITGGSGSGLFSGYGMITSDTTVHQVTMLKVSGWSGAGSSAPYYTFKIA